VVVTRPADRAAELVAGLKELGHDVLVCPLIAVEPIGPDEVDVSPYDWVIVTSSTGAAELAERLRGSPRRLAAIGPRTAEELRAHGLEPDLVASVATQEGLLEALPERPGRVLFAGAEGARRLLIDRLHADFVPLYRTTELAPEHFPDADIVVLASASAARAFDRLGKRIPAVTIGPQTTEAALAAGITILAEAATHDASGLVAAVAGVATPEPG
jgi:uroporphyrinogen III methyltransferase / synthase